MKHKILIIDDCRLDLDGIELLLESNGFLVKATTDSEVGIAFIRQNRGAVSLAIVDFNMPGANGAKVAEILKNHDPKLHRRQQAGRLRSSRDGLAMGLDSVIAMTGHKDLKLADHYSKIDGEVQKETSLRILDHIQKLGVADVERENKDNVFYLKKRAK